VQVATVMGRHVTQVRATVRSDESAIAAGRVMICNSSDLPDDTRQRREWIVACVGQLSARAAAGNPRRAHKAEL
jgi:hypothetical protein